MKITGAEWKEFENTGWPEGYIWEDESTLDDGTDLYEESGALKVGDAETFVVPDYWSVIKQNDSLMQEDDGKSIRSLIRAWRKERDSVTLGITVPREAEARLRELAAKEGWKLT